MLTIMNCPLSFKSSNWNEKITHQNGTEYVKWVDGEDYFCKYEITKPHGIISDLEQCKKDLGWGRRIDKALKFVQGSKKFLDEKIYGIIGTGGLTTVFDIGDNKVLKISEENPFEYRKYNPEFDIPLIGNVEQYDGIYGYIQARAITDDMDIKNVKEVKRKMRKAGFTASQDFNDYRTEQVGMYNGKSYLLDSRCAIKRNDLLTRVTKMIEKTFLPKILVAVNLDDTTDYFVQHIDEKPMPDYTFKEAMSRIKKAITAYVRATKPKI